MERRRHRECQVPSYAFISSQSISKHNGQELLESRREKSLCYLHSHLCSQQLLQPGHCMQKAATTRCTGCLNNCKITAHHAVFAPLTVTKLDIGECGVQAAAEILFCHANFICLDTQLHEWNCIKKKPGFAFLAERCPIGGILTSKLLDCIAYWCCRTKLHMWAIQRLHSWC